MKQLKRCSVCLSTAYVLNSIVSGVPLMLCEQCEMSKERIYPLRAMLAEEHLARSGYEAVIASDKAYGIWRRFLGTRQ